PKSPDANCSSAMNKRRTVLRVVSDLQKLGHLFFLRIGVRHWNIEVAQAEFLCFCFFLSSSMLTRLTQVDDRFHAVGFYFLELPQPWLPAGAELIVNPEKVSDRRSFLTGSCFLGVYRR